MAGHLTKTLRFACLCYMLLTALFGVGQTVAPPIAEYRGKAHGSFELTNDGDVPLAVIVEVHGFKVDENGSIGYQDMDPAVKVEFGANSFVIPPHGSHLVFYKVETSKPYAWFAFLNTFTKAAADTHAMRINYVLPHVVYVYQKQKIKKEDVNVAVVPGAKSGEVGLELDNRSSKLGRIEGVTWRGCEHNGEMGGFPTFPSAKRRIELQTGTVSADASAKVTFQDGFSIQVPLR